MKFIYSLFILASLFNYFNCKVFGQINSPNTPQFPTNTPANNSQTIIQQQNRAAMQNMGYKPPPTQEQIKIQAQNYAKIEAQRQKSEQQRRNEEVYRVIREKGYNHSSSGKYNGKYKFTNVNSEYYLNNIGYYKSAYQELKDMLEGNIPINVKRAIWLVENVGNKNSISYEEYLNQIEQVKNYVRQIMNNENLDSTDYLSKHYAIQKLYSDTADNTFNYDFNEIYGIKSGYVTKLLHSGSGQCRSMPLMYMILAQEFNIQSYIAFSPRHSYIKFKDRKGTYRNFETTNGFLTTDSWVRQSGNIRVEAIRANSYMYPITEKELIAHLLGDLANSYKYEMGYDNMMYKMLGTSLQYFPHLHAKMEMANLKTAQFDLLLWQLGYPSLEELKNDPENYSKWEELMNLYNHLEDIGYVEISEEEYEAWLKSVEEEKNKQADKALKQELEINLIKK